MLTFFGAVADYAAGSEPGQGRRIATLAVSIAKIAGLSQSEIDALYFAGLLRNAGALGNAALRKGEEHSERVRTMLRWDIPADGARLCERIAALPHATADIVRWQSECWDGTGYPDRLRWSGIPKAAQLLHISATYAAAADPEDGLGAITLASGLRFAPEQVRAFVTWYHSCGGRIETLVPDYRALLSQHTRVDDVLDLLSERIDAHNGTPERAKRMARLGEAIGKHCGFDAATLREISLASALFAIGELRSAEMEAAQFDPLARFGIEIRARHAVAAAGLIAQCDVLTGIAAAVRARAEWHDGTGAPDGLRHADIPRVARALAVAIAYDALQEAYRTRIGEERTLPMARLETAAGTQFDPAVVRALGEVEKART
jgi:response regulator RpfG family c-di-GMP phosphodiesterase